MIFFEGARITLEAHIAEYPAEYPTISGRSCRGRCRSPDRTIVLTSSTDTIEKHIKHRNRAHEDVVNMARRFRLIDGEFRRLAPAVSQHVRRQPRQHGVPRAARA